MQSLKAMASFLALSSIVLMAGCAHHIEIDPRLDKIRSAPEVKSSSYNVGYYIPEHQMLAEVNTPGGGGDSVTYNPYDDAQAALNTVLMARFARVYSVDSLEDSQYIERNNLEYIFIPTLTTDSSSYNIATWPPSRFEVELNCKAIDKTGDSVWHTSVKGVGEADYSDYTDDFGIAGRMAMEDAFLQLLEELGAATVFDD